MTRGKKIDITKIDLDELKEKTSENPGLISFPHTSGSAVIKPTDKGKIKGRAMAAMREQTEKQLQQLYDQMHVLVKHADEIKKRVKVSDRIYMAQMSFEPIIGQEYYLYEKEKEGDVLSMISPEQWGSKLPFKAYISSVRLLSDHTWEVLGSEDL